MSREYTAKEKKILSSNPYTFKVTDHKLLFTVDFKEAFWKSYQAGVAPRQILHDLGYDVEIFNQKQIDSLVQHIKKQAKNKNFTEGENRIRRNKSVISETDISSEQIWNEVKYLRQEVEFLKKIVSPSAKKQAK